LYKKKEGFVPGMSEDMLMRLEQRMDKFRDWNSVCDVWKLIHTFYHSSVIPHDKRKLRSDLVFLSEVKSEKKTMEKLKLATKTFKTEGSSEHLPIDFRFCVSTEKEIPERDVPVSVVPYRCTIKLRKEYKYSPADYSEPVLAFHLTKRWSGTAYVETMASTCDPPQCDLEIELLSETYLREHSATEIAFKMLWKLYSIIVDMSKTDPMSTIVTSEEVLPADG
jgi:hypothetical protein